MNADFTEMAMYSLWPPNRKVRSLMTMVHEHDIAQGTS
jgi:hypothetical protein